MSVFLKWLATALRDWLNGYISPTWKADQEKLQQDAAAHQRQHKQTGVENAAIEQGVVESERQIAKDQAEVIKRQQEQEERRANHKPSSISEALGYTDKP